MSAKTKRRFLLGRGVLFWFSSFLGLGLCGVIWYGIFTEQGANQLLRFVFKGMLSARELTLGQVQGTLMSGLNLGGLKVLSPFSLHKDTVMEAEQATITPYAVPSFPPFQLQMDNFQMNLPGKVERIKAQHVRSEESGIWVFDRIELEGVKGLPVGSYLKAQELHTEFPLSWTGVQRIKNGYILFPEEDPLILDLTQEADVIEGRLYTHAVDLGKLLNMAVGGERFPNLAGVLKDLDVKVRKEGDRFVISGPFTLAQFQHKTVQVNGCLAQAELDLKISDEVVLSGSVHLSGGTVKFRKTALNLETASILIKPDNPEPQFNVVATTQIESTRIKVKMQGTVKEPQIQLSSDPPRSQGILMVMLATGRGWKPARSALNNGQIDGEVLKDFVDYAVLGGLGNRLTSHFGIELVSVKAQGDVKGVEIQKTVNDRIGINTGVEYETTQTDQVNVRQSLGASYRVDGSTEVQLEAKRESLQNRIAEPDVNNTNQNSSEVLLKFKKGF